MNYGSNSIATDRPRPRFRALLPKARLRYAGLKRGRSSVVERQLPKLYVEGSIPFARSNFLRRPAATGQVLFAGKSTAALKRLRFLASFCQKRLLFL